MGSGSALGRERQLHPSKPPKSVDSIDRLFGATTGPSSRSSLAGLVEDAPRVMMLGTVFGS
jgi:hypothetical protein